MARRPCRRSEPSSSDAEEVSVCLTGSRQGKGGHKTIGPFVSNYQATESDLFLTLYANDAPLDLYILGGVHISGMVG